MSENLQGPACTRAASESIRALLADLEDAEKHCSISDAFAKQLTSDLVATRKQLAEAQADNAAMHSAAHRLALEAECFYLDCKDMALVSKWDDPLQTAISDVQAIRWSGDTKALDSAIAEAAEPYKALATDWLEFAKDVRPGCAAGSDWLSMLRERTIALAAKEAL